MENYKILKEQKQETVSIFNNIIKKSRKPERLLRNSGFLFSSSISDGIVYKSYFLFLSVFAMWFLFCTSHRSRHSHQSKLKPV